MLRIAWWLSSPGDSLITVAASLGIVLGLFFVLMWCFRRGMPKSTRSLPPEVVEVLGKAAGELAR